MGGAGGRQHGQADELDRSHTDVAAPGVEPEPQPFNRCG